MSSICLKNIFQVSVLLDCCPGLEFTMRPWEGFGIVGGIGHGYEFGPRKWLRYGSGQGLGSGLLLKLLPGFGPRVEQGLSGSNSQLNWELYLKHQGLNQ